MGRNHTPDCHTDEWTGSSRFKVYDPWCPTCQKDRRRADTYTLLLIVCMLTLDLLGIFWGVYVLVSGVYVLIKGII